MHQCTTPKNPPQAAAFPKVSHRLVVTLAARTTACQRGVDPAPAVAAAHRAYVASGGNRFAARRAAWAAVDAQCGRGRAA